MLKALITQLGAALCIKTQINASSTTSTVSENPEFYTPSDTCINGKYFCDCCGFNTLDSKWEYDICPICYWVDDYNNYAAPDESFDGSNHQTSLMRARHNYATLGSSHINRSTFVRQPYAHEMSHIFDAFSQFAICIAGKYFCPCCGYNTLLQEGQYHHCEICFWEDDPEQSAHPWGFGRNPHSLFQARLNFEKWGVSDASMLAYTRSPTDSDFRISKPLKDINAPES